MKFTVFFSGTHVSYSKRVIGKICKLMTYTKLLKDVNLKNVEINWRSNGFWKKIKIHQYRFINYCGLDMDIDIFP